MGLLSNVGLLSIIQQRKQLWSETCGREELVCLAPAIHQQSRTTKDSQGRHIPLQFEPESGYRLLVEGWCDIQQSRGYRTISHSFRSQLQSHRRVFWTTFRLIGGQSNEGESQKLEFLLHNFKESYERQNSARVAQQFRDPETIFTLVYAIVMLHTALYNPSVRRLAKPMTCEQFIANLRGVDAGDNLDEAMLRAIYNRVASTEFKTVYDVMDRLHAIDQTLIGLAKPEAMLQRHHRFIGWAGSYEVRDVSGHRNIVSRPTSHLRGLFIFNDMILVTKPVCSCGSHAVSELVGPKRLNVSLTRGPGVIGSDGDRSTNTIACAAPTTIPCEPTTAFT
ncbi:unnamed protein product [Schistocephalus solidus]|uniref:SEC7 domain-containing protein n=1 Tax=Schistocephalus solidus TaxID=70667 RepID=A0A183T4P5_SCHSO|nr:unnamed protein product [Schistocephalus solidus]